VVEELIIQATDDGPVRRYLRRMGMAERVISRYVEDAEQGVLVTIGFSSDADGVIPPLRLQCYNGPGFELTSSES
jgi:hypothetical protein